MNQEIVGVVFLIGAVQAVLLLVGINLSRPWQGTVKKVASLLLFTIALVMVYYLVLLTPNERISPYVDSLGSAAWMALMPLYYLLCVSLMRPKEKLGVRHLAYFPLSILFVLEEIATSMGLDYWLYYLVNDNQAFLDLWMGYFFSTGIYFTYKSLKLLKAEPLRIRLKELNFFSYAFLAVLVFFAISYMVLRKNYTATFELVLIALLEVFLFVLLYRVFKFTSFKDVLGEARYPHQAVSLADFESDAAALEAIMRKEQPYLDKKLNLNKLAAISGMSPNKLSQLFSMHYSSGFYEFVNVFRLNHVEQLLDGPESGRYTITAVAEMSGFNSKATFYKAFKQRHGKSPSAYIKQLSQSA